MDAFIKNLQKETSKKVKKVMSSDMTILEKSLYASKVYAEAFKRLKEYIVDYEFNEEAEEIQFFKEIKPRFFCHLIYYRKLYNIEMNRPVGYDAQRAYLVSEIEAINRYNSKRADFVRYYRSGHTHLDSLYYLRNRTETSLYLEAYYYEKDPKFSTNADFKVARIMSNEMLLSYLTDQLELLEQARTSPRTSLVWQDSKTDLIELIYMLDSKGSFGDITLAELTRQLSEAFHVQLDTNLSRTFCDMKIRNNPTPWIDQGKKALLERMQFGKRMKRITDDE